MDKSIYISMTGAKEAMDAQRLRANNLANVSTPGFKADFHQYRSMSVFGEHHPARAYAMGERPATDMCLRAALWKPQEIWIWPLEEKGGLPFKPKMVKRPIPVLGI